MFGCRSRPTASASRWKRRVASEPGSPAARIVLSATTRRTRVSHARWTTPMPPFPSSERRRNGPKTREGSARARSTSEARSGSADTAETRSGAPLVGGGAATCVGESALVVASSGAWQRGQRPCPARVISKPQVGHRTALGTRPLSGRYGGGGSLPPRECKAAALPLRRRRRAVRAASP